MLKSLAIRVTGKVQGVFYRQSTKRKALELGISGFVRNEPDGSVYIEAEADEDQLAIFTDWCRKGPPASNVEKLEIHEALCKNFSSFEIRH